MTTQPGSVDSVPIPPVRHSIHAVLTAEPVPHPDEHLSQGAAKAPGFSIPPPGMLRRFGASGQDIDAVSARSHVTLLHRSGPIESVSTDALAARAEAIAFARQSDGVVLDLAIPRVVAMATDPDLTIASEWVGFDIEPGAADDPHQAVTSFGLSTFGLPELRHEMSDPDVLAATLATLSGLVYRMIAEWPQHDPIGPATITLADVGHALGDALGTSAGGGLDVEILPTDDPGVLRVVIGEDPRALFA